MEVISRINVNKSPTKVKKKMVKNGSVQIKLDQLNNKKKTMSTGTNNNKPKVSPTSSPGVDCLEGMSSAELAMVRRLAGNDPVMRKRTLKKLRKWLNVLSQKVPDSPESRAMIEPNFIRVWKALFYCMWMADKPLPQEQLAESISDLQNIFASKTAPFLLFVEWFVRTMAREWSMIDRFRMDKFMMLFRRFLRKTLLIIADKKWHNDVLEGYMKILSVHLFNRHPPTKPKKNLQPNSPVNISAPLGLQIHFTDVFMEELAKVGASSLKHQKIAKILQVFINELGHSNDDRLLDEIRERIFNHLMRQSDVGLDYMEEMEYGPIEDDEDVNEDDQDTDVGEGEEEDDEKLGEEDQFLEDEAGNDDNLENGVLDPRAGAVDVILPQLEVDYSKLYQKLIEFGGQKEIKLKNRRILYGLASQFRELTEGKYPLALPEDDNKKIAIPRKQIQKAAQELLEFELADGDIGKRRKTKKERKREARRRLNSTSQDSVGSEDNSQYIQDEDLLDHVSDNYMSYLEEGMENGEVAEAETDEVDGVEDNQNEEVEEEMEPKGKQKKGGNKKGRKRKWKTVVEVEADDAPATLENDEEPPTLVRSDAVGDIQEEVIVVKKPKLGKKRASLGNNVPTAASTPLKGKARRLSELRTPTNATSLLNSSLTKSANKRVSFVLARNKEHDHADYPVSIARSPAIPFDKHKIPTIGLLKSPATTPKSTPIRRAHALDFF